MYEMIPILIIILVCLFTYYKALNNSLIIDDIRTYKTRYADKGRYSFTHHWLMGGIPGIWRFIVERLYGFGTFGFVIRHDNIFRIFLYTVICVLIYLAFGANQISFWAAILFALNPVNNQISLWSNGRRYVVNIILVLLMMICMDHSLWPVSLILYAMTMSFHVTAIFAPLALGNPWFSAVIPIVGWLAMPRIIKKINARNKIIFDDDRRKFTPKRFVIIVKQYGHYFFKMLLPERCQMSYEKMYYWGITEKGNRDAYAFNREFWIGAFAFVLSVALWYIVPGAYKSYVVFMVLATLQWCAIIPVIQDMADRYCNLANVFMMFFVSYLVHTYLGIYALPVLAALATYYFVNLKTVMLMYRNLGHFFEYHRYFTPALPAQKKELINHLLKENDVTAAYMLAREGLVYNPTEYIFLQQMAVCHFRIGEFVKAKEYVKKAMENYYIGQKEAQEKPLLELLKVLEHPEILNPNRKERRAREKQMASAK